MASTTFSNGTVIPVAWLNEVNALLWGSASPPATPIRVDSNGNVGINTSTPDTSGGKTLHVYNNTSTTTAADNSTIRVESLNRNANVQLRSSSVTGVLGFQAYGTAGTLLGQLSYNISTSAWSLQLTSGATIWTANSSGLVLNTSGATLGYGTGTGSTVTQTTSKTTTVTLNTASGRITMNNAALAGGAQVSFVLNNTVIASTDIVLVSIYETFSGANYSVRAATGDSYARITLTNETAGSLSDPVDINFIVMKGSIT